MIVGACGPQGHAWTERERNYMESLTTGTLAGTGSFRCEECGYVVTLAASDTLPDCPGCGGASFARAPLFCPPPRLTRHAPAPPAQEDPGHSIQRAPPAAPPRGEHPPHQDRGRDADRPPS